MLSVLTVTLVLAGCDRINWGPHDLTPDAVRKAIREGAAIAVVRIEKVVVRADLTFDGTPMAYYRFLPLKVLRESRSRERSKYKFSSEEEIWGGPAGQEGQLLPGKTYLVICYHVKYPILEYSREVSGVDDPFVRDVERMLGAGAPQPIPN
jgi:hypothetical protein